MPARAGRHAIVFDNEAVTALAQPHHPKHRAVLAHLQAGSGRNRRQPGSATVTVPTSVQVEAVWNRNNPRSASVNRFPIRSHILDGPAANRASQLRAVLGLSVADAHVGVAMEDLAAGNTPVTVVTSDVADMRRVAGHLNIAANPTLI